jgi:hypothetical protein
MIIYNDLYSFKRVENIQTHIKYINKRTVNVQTIEIESHNCWREIEAQRPNFPSKSSSS